MLFVKINTQGDPCPDESIADFSWSTFEWSTCINHLQTRSVVCHHLSEGGTLIQTVEDVCCKEHSLLQRPTEEQACDQTYKKKKKT